MIRCPTCGRRRSDAHEGCPPVVVSAEAAQPSAPPVFPTLDGFSFTGVLGKGGYGEVFAGTHLVDGRKVAIKVASALPAAAAQSLEREALALRTIGWPTVPMVVADGPTADGGRFLAMERIEAPTLAKELQAGPLGFGLDEFVRRATALIAAVGAVHQRGYLHRDLKPENIFFEQANERLRLIDFGLARPLDGAAIPSAGAASDNDLGTSEYKSPEQCTGDSLDVRSDIYALGVILYEMLTGRPPFFGAEGVVEQAHQTLRPPRPSDFRALPQALEDVVLSCLAKQPEERPPSAAALHRALKDAMLSLTPVPQAAPVAAAAPRKTATAENQLTVALLFIEAPVAWGALQERVSGSGGDLGSMTGARKVIVFSPERSEAPAKQAANLAEHLIRRGEVFAVVVDVARISAIPKKDGGRRYSSPLFSNAERFPRSSDKGVLLTETAAEALGRRDTEPAREGLTRLVLARVGSDDFTANTSSKGATLGREEILAELFTRIDDAFAEKRPSLCLVTGEAGIGKTQLALGLAQQARSQLEGAKVAYVVAREALGGGGYATLRHLVQALLPAPSEASPSRVRNAVAERLAVPLGSELELALSSVLGALSADAPELAKLSAGAGVIASLASRALGEHLRRIAAKTPLLLLVDEAQLADRPTLDALHFAALPEGGVPLWVGVFGRPILSELRPLWTKGAVSVGPLPATAAGALCRQLLLPAEQVPQDAVDQLVERSACIPLHLVELIAGLKRSGAVRQDPDSKRWLFSTEAVAQLPELPVIQWATEGVLRGLSVPQLAHARLAASLGAELRRRDLQRVLARLEKVPAGAAFPLDAGVGLQQLVQAGLLKQHHQERYTFRTNLLREAVLKTLAPDLAKEIHRAAVAALEADTSLGSAERLPRLAFHTAAAGMNEQAGHLYFELAERARRSHAYIDAETSYSRALGLLPESAQAEKLTAQRLRGLMLYRVGRYEDAMRELALAASAAVKLGDVTSQMAILLHQSSTLDWLRDFSASYERAKEAAPLAGQAASALLDTELTLALGRSAWRFNELPKAADLLSETVAKADRLGDDAYEPRIDALVCLGPILVTLNRVTEAEAVFERGAKESLEHTDRIHYGSALSNRLPLWQVRKKPNEAIDDFLKVLQVHRELGLADSECVSHYNLADIYFQLENLEGSMSHTERSLELAGQLRLFSLRTYPLLMKARLLLYGGDGAAANAIVGQLRKDSLASSTPLEGTNEMFARMVELSQGSASESEWDELEAFSIRVGIQQDPLEVIEARARWALHHGRRQEAQGHYKRAVTLSATLTHFMDDRLQKGLRLAS